jgi:hypothetical protein
MKNIFLITIFLASFLGAEMIRDDVNEVVYDDVTGLMWQDDMNASTVTRNLQGAIEYCESLTHAGHSDWHLPNITELKSIADESLLELALNAAFVSTVDSDYWSSTTSVSDTSRAWIVDFYAGYTTQSSNSAPSYVRCVR